MANQTAGHYLWLYRLRLASAEQGDSHPPADVVAAFRTLVGKLSAMNPSAPVKLTVSGPMVRFGDAETGELLAEFEFPPDV